MLTKARLDAIVYRVGGTNPCYVSEHDCSVSKDKDFYHSLLKLRAQVRYDLSSGFYSLGRRRYVRQFATIVDTVLPLRDGALKQSFFASAYEALDRKGCRSFISTCPTNYLSNEAEALPGSFMALGEVIQARYMDEGLNDLMRELPRAPLVTTFGLNDGERPAEVSAIIERSNGHFEACAPELSLGAKASDPFVALEKLERAISEDPGRARGHLLRSEPIFGPVDVQLSLAGSVSVKRFLISIAPCKNGIKYYRAYAPQAGVTVKSTTIEGALLHIKDAINLKFRNAPQKDIEKALKARPILTTARLN